MSRILEKTAAAYAAVLISTIALMSMINVPAAQAAAMAPLA